MVEELTGIQERKAEKVGNGQWEDLLEINGLLDAERKGIVSGWCFRAEFGGTEGLVIL
jgi:hypothetical protein